MLSDRSNSLLKGLPRGRPPSLPATHVAADLSPTRPFSIKVNYFQVAANPNSAPVFSPPGNMRKLMICSYRCNI